jgi:hypothetical protein
MGGWMKAAAKEQGIRQQAAEQQFPKTMRPTHRSLATNAERVCAEIMLKQQPEAR